MISRKFIAGLLISIGTFIIIASTYKYADILADAQWFFYVAGIFCLLGIFLSKNTKSSENLKFEYENKKLDENKEQLKEHEAQLEKRVNAITERNQELLHKLKIYNEWMEFPEMMENQLSNNDVSKFSECDKEVVALLRVESEYLFNKILNDEYKVKNELSWNLIIDDIIELITKIARIYQPDSKSPLLETNIEKLLRATNRISFQIIVLLDQMPMNIKEYNIGKVYEYVDSATHWVKSYKKIEPYIPAAQKGLYAARIAMGSNPATLALYALASEIAKQGGKKIGSIIAERYGVGLLHDIISIIGHEVANTFGGDFRHREINWLYGAELTELLHNFPVSQKILEHSLKEIGGLSLRSEYDRIYFYRCLSENKSAIDSLNKSDKSKDSHALDFLVSEERKEIAKKLETIFNSYVSDQSNRKVKQWVLGVERRLDIKLNIESLSENDDTEKIKSDAEDGSNKISKFNFKRLAWWKK
jgi:hypothetical protein